MNARANRLANALAALGVKRGDQVAIFQTNRWQYVEQYLAILKLGAVCVPMIFRLKSPEALFILNESWASIPRSPRWPSSEFRTRLGGSA